LIDYNPAPSKDWDLYLLGNIYFQLRDFENAVKYYRQFREVREAGGLVQWNNLYREGIALIELGKKRRVRNLLKNSCPSWKKEKNWADRMDMIITWQSSLPIAEIRKKHCSACGITAIRFFSLTT